MNLFQNAQTCNPTPTTSLLAIPLLFTLLAALIYIRKDYHAFLSLGPGGIPSTPTGYIHQCLLRPFALRDPLIPPPTPATLKPPTPERLSLNDDEASHSRIQTVSNPPRPPPYCQRPSTTAPNHPTRHQDLLRRAVAPAARARARPRLHARALHRDLVLREA